MKETCCCVVPVNYYHRFTLHSFSHFRVCFRHFNEEGDVENDVGAIPKSSFVALSPMLCISEYS